MPLERSRNDGVDGTFAKFPFTKVFVTVLFQEKVTNGPIPGARKDQLTFIAEQVSHHPPG